MNAESLLQHYEQIADAPDAIVRLRRFILNLAVRGKLVPQDPADEPAVELLKRIKSVGPQGRAEQATVVSEESTPFELPMGWVWTTIGSICSKTGSGSTPRGGKEVYVDRGIPFLRSQNIYDDGLRLSDVAYIAPEVHARMAGTAVRPSDLLLNITGGSMGRCSLVPEFFGEANISQHVAIVRLVLTDMSDFIHRLVLSPYFQAFIFDEQTGAGRGGLPKNRMDQIAVALPPLAEQYRIVAKVDELMALCDALEAARTERETTRDQLAAASLARLNTPDPETLRDDARFALDALPALTARPDQIKQLRRTVLNLAVRGKLVLQDPADEPAVELLKRIDQSKARLMKQGKLKRQKVLEPVNKQNLLEIPDGWEIACLGSVYDVRDGTHDTPKYVEAGVPLITSKNLSSGHLSFSEIKFISDKDHQKIAERSKVDQGDVLLAMIGSIGNPVVVDTARTFSIKNVALFKYYDSELSDPSYLRYFLQCAANQMRDMATGGLQPFVSLGFLRTYPIALPPLPEQHRIVAKVDELMSLCDQLETSLSSADETRKKLLDALLAEALAPVDAEVLQEAAE